MYILAHIVDTGVNWNTLVNGDTVPLVLCISMFGMAWVVTIIAIQWRRIRIAEAEAGLKLRLVERGFSTEEIERVVQATPNAGHFGRRRGPKAARSCCSSDFLVGDARG